MHKILDLIKGALIGVANVIPGLSGGTIAIILKIYDKLINAVSEVFSHPFKVIKSLLFILIGLALGIVIAVFGVTYFYEKYPVPTAFLFLGFVLGGLPLLIKEVNLKTVNFKKCLIFLLFFIITAFIPFLSGTNKVVTEFSIGNFFLFFALGIISSATMVIPGVSGSMVLMCLGYYESIMSLIKDCINHLMHFEMGLFFEKCIIVLPFAIGIILGIVLIAKLVKYLLKQYREITFYAILGLIVASPVGIIYNIENFQVNPVQIVLTIILFALGLFIPYLIENKLVQKFESLENRKR